ncbi:MAG: serine hydrolase domain-containing protein, partial [Candidatus Limiplasma sp.]|nr:serine hydrolase domain-containing protein [Candidatus Limiplasma sp.]
MFANIPRRAVPATRAGATPCPALRAHALYRAVALALALSLLLPGTPRAMAAAPPQTRAALHATLQQKLDAAFARYKTLGAVVCVIENGAVTDTFTYGSIAPDGAPMTADTLFRVGSISKMVTAVGVMQLVERGTLALDGDVGAVLGIPLRNPQYPDIPITLRQLMSHSAGLRDSGHYTIALRGEARPLAELFAQPQVRYLFHPGAAPGSRTEYSNFGGGLLGSVLEAATGQTVDAYMAANVFAPLGITAAYQSGALPAGVTVSDMYIMPGRRRA